MSFWQSLEGVRVRLEDLAELISYRTYNNAFQVYASSAGVKLFEWRAELDDRTCEYCSAMDGRVYRRGQFMPGMPAHPGCRCTWDIGFEEA